LIPLLVQGLSIEYRASQTVNKAVNAVSFSVDSGEVVGLVGESGSGKSTAILGVLGLTRRGGYITGGDVLIEGRSTTHLREEEWRQVRGARIGLITQNPRASLNPVMRVGPQIMKVYQAHNKADNSEARARALSLLRAVGINDPERRFFAFPHELSGGMAQRAVIAMALSCSPRVLIADEPTSGLDVTIRAQVLDDLRRVVSSSGSSLLLVTQDLGIVANYCDRVYMMHVGEIVEEAGVDAFFNTPAHPATAALMAAHLKELRPRLALRGFPIDGRRLPSGCWLHPRCPFAEAADGCFERHPPPYEVEPGHWSRCHRYREVIAVGQDQLQPGEQDRGFSSDAPDLLPSHHVEN